MSEAFDMRVCMVSPVAPPVQAANSLLPTLLARELASRGVDASFIAHRSAGRATSRTDSVTTLVPRRGSGWWQRSVVGAAVAATRIALGASPQIRRADLVHLHSNGLIVEVAELLARRRAKPFVVTLYGTDIWHHDPRRHRRFAGVVKSAGHRVFYSRALMTHARTLGLAPEPSTVIYAPVADTFRRPSAADRDALRGDLGVGDGPLLLTVKRLHPVAGHPDLLSAMPAIVARHPGVRLWIVGEGELRGQLERQTAELGLARSVRFLGQIDQVRLRQSYAAADLFVLPSRLESWGSVSLEAIACGTPVVASDTVGSLEVGEYFPDDVTLFACADAEALGAAVSHALEQRRRASSESAEAISVRFSPEACAAAYLNVYRSVSNRP